MYRPAIYLDIKLLLLALISLGGILLGGAVAIILYYAVCIFIVAKSNKHIIPVLLLSNFVMAIDSSAPQLIQNISQNALIVFCFFMTIIRTFVKEKIHCGIVGKWFAFTAICFLLSIIVNSQYIVIGLLKLIIFVFLFYTIYLNMQHTRSLTYMHYLYNFWLILIVLCVAVWLFYPSGAYAGENRSFQGITVHSQWLGVLLSMLGFLFLTAFIYYRFLLDRYFVVIFAFNTLLLFLCASRTAVFAFVISHVLVLLYATLLSRDIDRAIILKVILVTGLVCIGGCITFQEQIISFAFKEARRGVTYYRDVDSLYSSRIQLAETTLENFKKAPFWGIGFASPNESKDFEVIMLPGTSIPVSAPTEKGNFLLASLETVGLIGTTMLLGLLLLILLTKQAQYRVIGISSVIIGLVLNMGEDFLFGVNGNATLFWVLCLLATDDTRSQIKNRLISGLTRGMVNFGVHLI
ncbi:hypothetical protein ES707_13454 [subsurface metagenome]